MDAEEGGAVSLAQRVREREDALKAMIQQTPNDKDESSLAPT
jgi:hypothetical protein